MSDPKQKLEASVRERFARIASDPSSEHAFPVGPASAKRLGYAANEVDALPRPVSESFAGVGNPLLLGEVRPGDVVLDLGCGAGFDSLLAASRVDPTGKVVGVDLTPEMVAKAQANARLRGTANVDFRVGRAERLPLESASVDVVITNGVFNLCIDKTAVVAEIWRVLKPGGRLQMADILLEPHVTPEELQSKGEWSA